MVKEYIILLGSSFSIILYFMIRNIMNDISDINRKLDYLMKEKIDKINKNHSEDKHDMVKKHAKEDMQ